MHVVIKTTIFANKFMLLLFLVGNMNGFPHVIICDNRQTEPSVREMAKLNEKKKQRKLYAFEWKCGDMPHRSSFAKYTWCHIHMCLHLYKY